MDEGREDGKRGPLRKTVRRNGARSPIYEHGGVMDIFIEYCMS